MTPARRTSIAVLAALSLIAAAVAADDSKVKTGAKKIGADVGAFLGCALLQGQPAVDACDEAIRSRLPAEIRAEAAHKKGVELGELTRYGDAVKAYRAAVRLKPDYAAAYTNLGFLTQSARAVAGGVLRLRERDSADAERRRRTLQSGRGSGHARRSEERRVGKECRSRWSPYH